MSGRELGVSYLRFYVRWRILFYVFNLSSKRLSIFGWNGRRPNPSIYPNPEGISSLMMTKFPVLLSLLLFPQGRAIWIVAPTKERQGDSWLSKTIKKGKK